MNQQTKQGNSWHLNSVKKAKNLIYKLIDKDLSEKTDKEDLERIESKFYGKLYKATNLNMGEKIGNI